MDAIYIENAATWRDADGNSNYMPCDNGVHLCGQTDDGEQPVTLQNYPFPHNARHMWQAAKDVAECPYGEPHDFVVDLMIGGDLVDDFCSNRQLWPRALAVWAA